MKKGMLSALFYVAVSSVSNNAAAQDDYKIMNSFSPRYNAECYVAIYKAEGEFKYQRQAVPKNYPPMREAYQKTVFRQLESGEALKLITNIGEDWMAKYPLTPQDPYAEARFLLNRARECMAYEGNKFPK